MYWPAMVWFYRQCVKCKKWKALKQLDYDPELKGYICKTHQ
jgi:hypothetical protein